MPSKRQKAEGGVGRGEERAVSIGQRAVADERGRAAWVVRCPGINGHLAVLGFYYFGKVAFLRARHYERRGWVGRRRLRAPLGWNLTTLLGAGPRTGIPLRNSQVKILTRLKVLWAKGQSAHLLM